MNWIDIKVVVGVLSGSESIATAAMLTQKLHSLLCIWYCST